jgi:putative cardiolipin synthase
MKLIVLALLLSSFTAFAGIYSETIPYPFYAEQSSKDNEITLLNRPEEALEARLDMIARAQKSIEVEYYIYDLDESGKLMTLELLKAAKRGVKVRMLLDYFLAGKSFDPYIAAEVAKHGIEVKYYNDASFIRLSTVQFRNHRKLLSVDDKEAITGGRNIGNNYFNLAADINYDDRDILLKGPIVQTLRESFDVYFNDDISSLPKIEKKPSQKKSAKALEFLQETEEITKVRNEIREMAEKQAVHRSPHTCADLTYSTDAPGATFLDRIKRGYKEDFRFVRKTFMDKILPIDKHLTISSPYFIPNKRNRYLLESLLKKGVKVSFHTNSLASTDAIMMSANLYLRARSWIKKGLELFLHDGKSVEMYPGLEGGVESRIRGTHAKTHIYETSTYNEIMVGTYNFDNRSDFYNSEMAIFCKGNDELTDELKADINMRIRNGIKVNSDGKAQDRNGNKVHITGATKERILKMQLMTFPSRLIDFLL